MYFFYFPDASRPLMFYPSTPAAAGQQQSRILLLAWRELGELAYRTMVVNLLSKLEAISLFWHKLDLNSVIIGNLITSMKEK